MPHLGDVRAVCFHLVGDRAVPAVLTAPSAVATLTTAVALGLLAKVVTVPWR